MPKEENYAGLFLLKIFHLFVIFFYLLISPVYYFIFRQQSDLGRNCVIIDLSHSSVDTPEVPHAWVSVLLTLSAANAHFQNQHACITIRVDKTINVLHKMVIYLRGNWWRACSNTHVLIFFSF